MAHGKRAWRYKKRAWRNAILKGPRGNTKSGSTLFVKKRKTIFRERNTVSALYQGLHCLLRKEKQSSEKEKQFQHFIWVYTVC